jgi:hypothetical protein
VGTFQVGFGVVLADTYSGAQGERLFSRAPDVNHIVRIVVFYVGPNGRREIYMVLMSAVYIRKLSIV